MEEQQKQFVLSLLAYAVQRGVAAEELCRLCHIDLEALRRKQGTITKKKMSDLWKSASQLCHDPLFGLHFGESLQLPALGAVGEIIKSSDTVGQAITIAASFIPAITDLFRMEIEKSKHFIIRLIPGKSEPDDFVSKQAADLLMAFTIHELDGFLLQKIRPVTVGYPYKPLNPGEYERVLRCKPVKRVEGYSLEFSARYWEEPVLSANYELQKLFLEKISTESSEQFPSAAFKVRILDYLMKNAYLGILSLEDVAANFNMTPRSLQRRLQHESVTFQQLSDSVRMSLALHYLESGKHQIKEISYILGYNDLSAFSRAFKRWTGKAPIEYFA